LRYLIHPTEFHSIAYDPLSGIVFGGTQDDNSLAISPVNSRILFAGTGSTSSFGFDSSPGFGVARSTDSGHSWTVLAQDTFARRRINSTVGVAIDGYPLALA
jgi:hypothetical protein